MRPKATSAKRKHNAEVARRVAKGKIPSLTTSDETKNVSVGKSNEQLNRRTRTGHPGRTSASSAAKVMAGIMLACSATKASAWFETACAEFSADGESASYIMADFRQNLSPRIINETLNSPCNIKFSGGWTPCSLRFGQYLFTTHEISEDRYPRYGLSRVSFFMSKGTNIVSAGMTCLKDYLPKNAGLWIVKEESWSGDALIAEFKTIAIGGITLAIALYLLYKMKYARQAPEEPIIEQELPRVRRIEKTFQERLDELKLGEDDKRLGEINKRYEDAVFYTLMNNPFVLTNCGHSFDRSTLTQCTQCPNCRMEYQANEIVENFSLKSLIEADVSDLERQCRQTSRSRQQSNAGRFFDGGSDTRSEQDTLPRRVSPRL